MSDVTILNLPISIGLTGAEYFPIVQGGTTKRAQTSLIADLAALPVIDNNTLLANTSGSAAQPVATTQSQMLDTLGSTQGDIVYRSASGWSALSAGTSGQYLKTNGAGSDPSWSNLSVTPAGSNTQVQINVSGALGASSSLTFSGSTLTVGVSGGTTGKVALTGATSGAVTLQTAAAAGSWTLQLPTSAGTNGYVLSTDGTGVTSWIANGGGGGGVPGGSNTQVQYNSAGSFAANAGFTFDGTSQITLGVAGASRGSAVFAGSTSGTVTVRASAAAGSWTLTLPTSGGTSGYVLSTDGSGTSSWVAQSGGGGSPGGSNTQVQFNNAGSFDGAAGFVFDGTSKITMGVAGASVGGVAFSNATSGTITLNPATGALGSAVLTLPAATDTLVGKATTDTLTNKTFDTAGTGNVFRINSTTITAVTGSGSVVLATSPTLVTPALGTPSSATLTNATGLPISTGVSGLGTGVATFLATPSSANLAAAVTDETGSGALVFATSPTLTTPNIGAATGSTLALTGTSPQISLGANSGTLGGLKLFGSTSGDVTLKVAAAAGTATVFQLPATNGTNGYVLQTDGTGVTSWVANSGGGGTVTSVAQSFTGGLISVAGSPITGSGTLALTVAGTSGGIPYFSSSSAWASSGALTSGAVVLGGGAGAAPNVSANLTFATSTLTVGVAGAATGTLALTGSTSGTISIQGQAAAGTYNFNLPTAAGTSGQPLLSGGGGASAMTFGTLGVAAGGTGLTSGTSGGVLAFTASGTLASSGALTSGALVLGGGAGAAPSTSANFTTSGSTLTLGVATSAKGALALAGNTSGTVTVQPAAAAGTWSLTLPTSGGTSGYVLSTDGTGITSWVAQSGGGGSPGGSSGNLQYNNASAFGGMSGTSWDDTNRALTITGATVTTSNPILNLTQTWNAGAVTFTALKLDVTSTASASGSLLADLKVGGSTMLSISKAGALTIGANSVILSDSSAGGTGALVLGDSGTSCGSGANYAVAIGSNASAGYYGSVCIGRASASGGNYNVCIGWGASGNTNNGTNSESVAIGHSATIGFNVGSGIAIGSGATTTAQYQAVFGGTTYYIDNVFFGKGVTNATPIAYTINGTGGSGTNIAGADLILAGGKGTGTGVGGKILFKAAAAGSSGTSLNALATYFTIDGPGNVVVGNAALSTGATDGFFYAPSTAGAASGTPTSYTGRVPICVDTTNGKLQAYYGGAWHTITFT